MKQLTTKKYFGFILVILATACWASSGIFINRVITKTGWTPFNLAFWRDFFTTVSIGLIVLVFVRDGFKIKKKDIPWFAAMGVFSIGIFHVLWNYSIMNNGVGVATILGSNAPLFVTIMAYLAWKEPLSPKKIAAILLSIIGTLLVSDITSVSASNMTTVGILIGLGSALSYSTMSIFGKKLSADYNTWTILFYGFVFATILLFFTQLGQFNVFGEMLSHALPDFAALIVFSTVLGFWLYNFSLKFLDASVASITGTSEVVFASIASFVVLNERMEPLQILGGVLIVIGVVLVSLPKRKLA